MCSSDLSGEHFLFLLFRYLVSNIFFKSKKYLKTILKNYQDERANTNSKLHSR